MKINVYFFQITINKDRMKLDKIILKQNPTRIRHH